MTNQGDWQASLIEQRTAWGIALCCIVLIVMASSQPQWFESSLAPTKQAQNSTITPISPNPSKVTRAIPPPQESSTKAPPVQPKETIATPPTTLKRPPEPTPKIVVHKTRTPSKNVIVANGFYIQLGAFKERARARGLADQLKIKGWSVKLIQKKDKLHAVWIGPKNNRQQAVKLMRDIQIKLKYKGFIIQHHS